MSLCRCWPSFQRALAIICDLRHQFVRRYHLNSQVCQEYTNMLHFYPLHRYTTSGSHQIPGFTLIKHPLFSSFALQYNTIVCFLLSYKTYISKIHFAINHVKLTSCNSALHVLIKMYRFVSRQPCLTWVCEGW